MRTIALVLTLLFLAGCGNGPGDSASAPQDDLVLRTYEVPDGKALDLRHAIGNLLRSASEEGGNIGNTAILDSGRIAVLAPESIQEGIEAILEEVGEAGPGEPSRIRFQIWLVEIQAGKSSEMPESLVPVANSLQAVSDNLGSAAFSRIDYVEQVVRSGAPDASIGGQMLRGQVSDVVARGESIDARIELISLDHSNKQGPPGRVETEISFTTGETLVLGVIGTKSEGENDTFQAFVVRAERF